MVCRRCGYPEHICGCGASERSTFQPANPSLLPASTDRNRRIMNHHLQPLEPPVSGLMFPQTRRPEPYNVSDTRPLYPTLPLPWGTNRHGEVPAQGITGGSLSYRNTTSQQSQPGGQIQPAGQQTPPITYQHQGLPTPTPQPVMPSSFLPSQSLIAPGTSGDAGMDIAPEEGPGGQPKKRRSNPILKIARNRLKPAEAPSCELCVLFKLHSRPNRHPDHECEWQDELEVAPYCDIGFEIPEPPRRIHSPGGRMNNGGTETTLESKLALQLLNPFAYMICPAARTNDATQAARKAIMLTGVLHYGFKWAPERICDALYKTCFWRYGRVLSDSLEARTNYRRHAIRLITLDILDINECIRKANVKPDDWKPKDMLIGLELGLIVCKQIAPYKQEFSQRESLSKYSEFIRCFPKLFTTPCVSWLFRNSETLQDLLDNMPEFVYKLGRPGQLEPEEIKVDYQHLRYWQWQHHRADDPNVHLFINRYSDLKAPRPK